jgi:hypothetical protein
LRIKKETASMGSSLGMCALNAMCYIVEYAATTLVCTALLEVEAVVVNFVLTNKYIENVVVRED